jgi:DNA (cytosine-5)-methyltransferase 1
MVAASVEVDPHAVATQRLNHVFRKRHRTNVINEDVRDVPIDRLIALARRHGANRPHILMGGPPCQGFSRSNMRTRTLSNPLNNLYRDFLALVSQLRPPVVVIENVADLVGLENGRVERDVLKSLRELRYQVGREILDAVDYGVPQKRKRVFFLATRLGGSLDFPEPNVRSGQCTTVWEAISDLPSLTNGHTADEMLYGSVEPMSEYQKRMRNGSGPLVRNNLVSRNNDLVVQRYHHIPQGGNWRCIPDDLMANYADRTRCHEWIYRRLHEGQPSVTITNFRKNMLIHPREHRGLSVREAARLQSFPDRFVFCGSIGFQQQQVANAVPPLLARAVAKCLRHHLGM